MFTFPITLYQVQSPALYDGDPYLNKVVLFIRGNGSNGSTLITDITGKTVNVSGDTVISSNQSKFNNSSIYFDGNGDFLTIPLDSSLTFGSQDFTWEGWVYCTGDTANANTMTIFGNAKGYASGNAGIFLVIHQGKFVLRHWVNDTSNAISSQNILPNTWYHVAATKSMHDGSSPYPVNTSDISMLSIFVNGVRGINGLTTLTNTDNDFTIGTTALNAGHATDFQGYMSHVRLTKGVVRYTANFATPTSEYLLMSPNLTYVSSGDTNGIFYYLGNDGFTWVNPSTTGKIQTTFTGGVGASLITARDGTSTNANNCYTDSFIGASITIDLKNKSLLINKYTIQMSDSYLLRSWDFEGSNDNSTWATLDSQRNTEYQPYEWVVRNINTDILYRYFRVVQQGNDSAGGQYICIAELELYGILSYVQA